MSNLLAKRQKLAIKEHKIKTRLLGIKGAKFYILKRQGSTQSFITLATFDYANVDFNQNRHSAYIQFAVIPTQTFTRGDTTRTMSQIAGIATHIAMTTPAGASIVYAIRTGDEFEPFYFDAVFQYFVKQVGDTFDPEENE